MHPSNGRDESGCEPIIETQAPAPAPASTPDFTSREWRDLVTLRQRYQQDHDLFSPQELARLRFLRWLHETGKLAA
jgi:hypothetical protein